MNVLLRRLACLAGCLIAAPLAVLAAWTLVTPITASGCWYLVSCIGMSVGLITTPWRRMRYRGLTRGSAVVFVAVAITRTVVLPFSSTLQLRSLPSNKATGWPGRLVDEQDVALFGARVMMTTGVFLTAREAHDLIPTLAATYHAMRNSDGKTPSPFFGTYLGMQQPAAFDLLVAEPTSAPLPRTALVFLHGFTGNFTIQCWLVAQAARQINAVTVCPSVGWRGDWWSDEGEQTLRATLQYLREQGITRIYLAGLSNGAVGVSRLAPGLASDLSGLILIAGGDPYVEQAQLPVLVIQASDDERMPAVVGRAVARHAGPLATYVELDGDHFVLAKRADEIRTRMVQWLEEQEAAAR